jgi:hypothetical protein
MSNLFSQMLFDACESGGETRQKYNAQNANVPFQQSEIFVKAAALPLRLNLLSDGFEEKSRRHTCASSQSRAQKRSGMCKGFTFA